MAIFMAMVRRVLCLFALVLGIGGCGPRFKCPPKPTVDPQALAFAERGGKDSSKWGQSGVQDARIAIDPAHSTYCYEFYGGGWQAPVFGTLDVTIDSACTEPTCTFTMDNIRLTTGDLTIPGHSLTDVHIVGDPNRYQRGLWSDEGVFFFDKLDFSMYTEFNLDDVEYARLYSNDTNEMVGRLSRDYSEFSFAGELIRSDNVAVTFDLRGYPVAHPPKPVITPIGTIFTDEPGIAHASFSAERSTDQDGDIKAWLWSVDNSIVPSEGPRLSTILKVGQHAISVRVSDSRWATVTATEIITVLEK